MDIRRIPLLKRLFASGNTPPVAGAHDLPTDYTVQEICESIEHLVEQLVAVRQEDQLALRQTATSLYAQDAASAPYITRLEQHYLALPPYVSSVSARLIAAISAYREELGETYLHCVSGAMQQGESALLPLLTQRALYHHGMQMKWLWLRYQAIPAYLWSRMHKLYGIAEKHRFARTALPLPSPDQPHASCETLYLRPQILHSLRPDTLLPREIELASRWIARWGQSVLLDDSLMSEKHSYGVNLKGRHAPQPLAALSEPGNYRYWGAGLMLAAMHAQHDESANSMQQKYEGWRGALWDKVVNSWSGRAPMRRHQRRLLDNKHTELFLGFDQIHQQAESPLPQLSGLQRCQLRDESTEGYCVMVDIAQGMQLEINALVGLAAGRQLLIGIVCRLRRHDNGWIEVGIRRLAAHAVPVKLESNATSHTVDALYVALTGITTTPRRCVLVPASHAGLGGPLRLLSKGRRHLIRLRPPIRVTHDYVLADFDSIAPEAAAA